MQIRGGEHESEGFLVLFLVVAGVAAEATLRSVVVAIGAGPVVDTARVIPTARLQHRVATLP